MFFNMLHARGALKLPCTASGSTACTRDRFPHLSYQSSSQFFHRPWADSAVQDKRGSCKMVLTDRINTLLGPAAYASAPRLLWYNSLYVCTVDQHCLQCQACCVKTSHSCRSCSAFVDSEWLMHCADVHRLNHPPASSPLFLCFSQESCFSSDPEDNKLSDTCSNNVY